MPKKYTEEQQLLSKQHYPMFVCTKEQCEILKEVKPLLLSNGVSSAVCFTLRNLSDCASAAKRSNILRLRHMIEYELPGTYLHSHWPIEIQKILGPHGSELQAFIRTLWIDKLINYSKKFHYSGALEEASKNNRR